MDGFGWDGFGFNRWRYRERVRAERARRRRERAKYHLAISQAEIRLSEGVSSRVVEARVLLNEVNEFICALFTREPIKAGNEVALTIQHPKQFYVRARVVGSCLYGRSTAVLSETGGFEYRIWLKPVFETEEEARDVRAYADWIRENLVCPSGGKAEFRFPTAGS